MAKYTSLESLDAAFTMPESAIPDANLRELYHILLSRMMKEAEGTPMLTGAYLVMERCAAAYVTAKYKESQGARGFSSSSAYKEFNAFFLSTLAEFNKMIAKKTPEEVREEIQKEVLDVVLGVIAQISNPKVREALVKQFEAAFAKAGI